jgi:hypothetical protein
VKSKEEPRPPPAEQTSEDNKAKLRKKREADWLRAELTKLRDFSRNAKSSFKPSKIRVVPPGMAFVPRPPLLLKSAVWRGLGIYERRMLEALEIEHCRHGGKENGYLILTYDQAVQAGIERRYFLRTIETLKELKLIEVTHTGQYGSLAKTDPNLYRLTYLLHKHAAVSGAPTYFHATHDWIDVELAILNGQRKLPPPRHVPPQRKRGPKPTAAGKKPWKKPTVAELLIIAPGRLLAR